MKDAAELLAGPLVLWPTEDAVSVVWYQRGLSPALDLRTIPAVFAQEAPVQHRLSRLVWADAGGGVEVFRHEVRLTGLGDGRPRLYALWRSHPRDERVAGPFRLQVAPAPGQGARLLLTSDFQNGPAAALSCRQALRTAGRIDAVLYGGDMVNVPNRAAEWFGPLDDGKLSFFQILASSSGAPLLSEAPLFPAIGNHEIMGPSSAASDQNVVFNSPRPEWAARILRPVDHSKDDERVSPHDNEPAREAFEFETYRELWTPPSHHDPLGRWYFHRFGDLALIVLDTSRIWRPPVIRGETPGKYEEPPALLADPIRWGFGEFPFADLRPGSPQFAWLEKTLAAPAFTEARWKIAMTHHSVFGLGDNTVPVLAHPVMDLHHSANGSPRILSIDTPIEIPTWKERVAPLIGRLTAVRYRYPRERDMWRPVESLLGAAGVQLVLCGHAHLWNRSVTAHGMHLLETSQAGNTYGAYLLPEHRRTVCPADANDDYPLRGDPHGRRLIPPSLFSPQPGLPAVADPDLTVFTLFDSATGDVTSYCAPVNDPEAPARAFDRFSLLHPS
ncbi:MAG: hypothetical protein EA425_13270 [Puniceicoccaceae bacterium]|nr:MAG: hypothetical protein EA425_13270 [Puniceicoccaceae bacterium]